MPFAVPALRAVFRAFPVRFPFFLGNVRLIVRLHFLEARVFLGSADKAIQAVFAFHEYESHTRSTLKRTDTPESGSAATPVSERWNSNAR